MATENEHGLWNQRPSEDPSPTAFQLVNLRQTQFFLDLSLEKDVNATLTDVLDGNASDDCLLLLFLSLSPSCLSFFPFFQSWVLKNPFLTISPLACLPWQYWWLLEWLWFSLHASVVSSGWNGFHFLLPSWDLTHLLRSNRSTTSSLPSFLFLLSLFLE